jgi:hypothetical protein
MRAKRPDSVSTTEALTRLQQLSNEALLANIRGLLGRERRVTARLVAHLAEADARRLAQAAGYSSLFVYCCEALLLSEHEAYLRIHAARASRRFPLILELLFDGRINLTNVAIVAPHLTEENHRGVLQAACGKRKEWVRVMASGLDPKPEVRAAIRRLASAEPSSTGSAVVSSAAVAVVDSAGRFRSTATCASADRTVDPATPEDGALSVADRNDAPAVSDREGALSTPDRGGAPARPASTQAGVVSSAGVLGRQDGRPTAAISPLAPDRHRYQVTIDSETRELLERARDLLRHSDPSGTDGELLKRALKLLLMDLERKKFGVADQPQRRTAPRSGERRLSAKSRDTPEVTRHIPAVVKRAVFVRDAGRCAFVAPGGHRCNERGLLEYHHVRPYAAGGEPTTENISLRCRSHNQYEAWAYFDRGEGGREVEIAP